MKTLPRPIIERAASETGASFEGFTKGVNWLLRYAKWCGSNDPEFLERIERLADRIGITELDPPGYFLTSGFEEYENPDMHSWRTSSDVVKILDRQIVRKVCTDCGREAVEMVRQPKTKPIVSALRRYRPVNRGSASWDSWPVSVALCNSQRKTR